MHSALQGYYGSIACFAVALGMIAAVVGGFVR
jgi:hypothetical protein